VRVAGANLARTPEQFTERFVFKTQMIAVLLLGTASAASAQQAGSGNVPRADYISTMDIEFRKMDGDKNGKVTRAEIEAFERGAALGQARARAQAMFVQLDTDRNGQLSAAEFGKMITGSPQVDGRPFLAKLDTNKDGAVSLIEHRAGKLSYFDQIDSDKDGIVTVAEMKAAGVIK
jgi:Ca2+-binding EF-hand superfamily protein